MTDYFDADEEAAVREYLTDGGDRAGRSGRPAPATPGRRDGRRAGAGPSLDTAVLVRHWLRRLSERDGTPYRARLAPGIETMVQPFRDRTGLSQHGDGGARRHSGPSGLTRPSRLTRRRSPARTKAVPPVPRNPTPIPHSAESRAGRHLPFAGAACGRAGRGVTGRRRDPHHDDSDWIGQDRGGAVPREPIPGCHDDDHRPNRCPGL